MTRAADRIRGFIHGLRPLTSVAVVAANLVPIACVILFGWPAGVLLLLYWAENVVIGLFNAAKLVITSLAWGAIGAALGLFIVPFFVFHYGMFCFVHGIFVVSIGSIGGPDRIGGAPSPLALFDLVAGLVKTEAGFGWSLAAIAGLQLFSFLFDWLARGRYRTTNPTAQMFEPYGRIVVLHLTLILGALPVALMGNPIWALVALALFKTLFDLGALASGFKDDEETTAKTNAAMEALRQRLARRR